MGECNGAKRNLTLFFTFYNDGGFAFVPLADNFNFSTKLQSGITPNPVLALGF